MKANYHTHSNFCDHASGDVEEYIKAAIEVGMTELGISEHGSYIFPDGYESRYRIKKARVSEYVKQ